MAREATQRRADRDPVDPYFAGRLPPDAMAADGELVPNAEIEAAAELVRFSRRFGRIAPGLDGFALYRLYRRVTRRFRADG